MEDKMVGVAMNIILHAGDARAECMKGLTAISKDDYDNAQKHIKQASLEIRKAHQAQTEQLQEEASGEHKIEYSVLFSHAQDTLMTVISEINLAKQILKISKNFDEKIKELE